VLLFPLGATSGAVVSGANELNALVVAGETFLYKLKSNLSSYTAPIRVDKNNGTLWYEQTLNMILASDSKELRSEIHLLAQNEVMCLVENADGTIVALGLGEGLQVADANEYTSGILKSDRKGHVIVLKGMENDELPDVNPSLYATLFGQQSPSI
jgi:hypothetical protein